MSSSPSQYAMPTPQPYTNDSSITPTYPNASYAPAQQPSQPFSSTTPVDSQTVEKSGNSGDVRSRSTGYKGTRKENSFATNMCLYGTCDCCCWLACLGLFDAGVSSCLCCLNVFQWGDWRCYWSGLSNEDGEELNDCTDAWTRRVNVLI